MSVTKEKLRDHPKLKERNAELPRINLRPFLFIALGLAFGILLYMRCRFGGLKGSDFVLFALILVLSFRPLSFKRVGTILLCFCFAAGAGAGLMHLKCETYRAGLPAGEYEITGTVISFTVGDGDSALLLDNLTLGGVKAEGKLSVSVPSESVRTGDKISFTASVTRSGLPKGNSSYAESLFIKDIRYFAALIEEEFSVMGRGNALLRLNGAVYDLLHEHLSKTQADTAYALMTGNSGSMDDSFTTAIRQGGVAHIFAVSGLHVGILYAAVSLLFCRLRKFKFIPAIIAVILYAAFCGFSVSSVRAVIMCAVLGIYSALGRKYDFLGAISFAATLVLLITPAEWLSAGFRLSFGACIGLALYTQKFKRAFKKLPRFVGDYLAANFSVQLFTLPVLLDTFGYVSLWGTVLNLFLIPILPILFLGLLFTILLSLIIPPAAAVFLALPGGMLSLFSWLFAFDFSLVLSGFTLGTGGAVWTGTAVLLSDRVRLKEKMRIFCSIFLTALFMFFLVMENAVFTGCKLIVIDGAILIETRMERILVIDGSLSTASYQNFLDRYYGGRLNAIIIVCENVGAGLSDALFLPADEVRACSESDTALMETVVFFETEFSYGKLLFRFESKEKLMLTVEERTVEIDFSGTQTLGSDLFLSDDSAGVYYLRKGSIYVTS